jgi:putative DNA primase/helicase
VIYFLANGQGKQRANRYGTARRIHRWNVIVLSTGEHSIETHLEQKRIQAKAGQSVRLLNVPVSGQHGAFSNLHGCVSGRAFSDLMQNQVQKYYGTAGPAFLEWLVKGTQDIGERLETTLKAFKPDNLTGQEGRAARRFALVSLAGDLATEAEITGWEKGTAHDAALACFWHWRSYRGTGDLERLKVLQVVSEFTERHGDSRFSFLDMSGRTDGELVRDRAGYWRRTPTDDIQYLFNSAGLREALIGFDFQKGLAILKDERWLTVGSDSEGRSRTQVKVNGRNSNFYAVTIGDIDDAVAPVAPEENTGATDGDQAECRGSTGSTSSTEKEVDQASRENNLSTTIDEDSDSEVLA